MIITKDTKLCMSLAARPGNFGTLFHNYLYNKLDLAYVYKAFTTNNLHDAIYGIKALYIRGCAISMPYKESCIQYLDELDISAASIQSVNTIVNTEGYLKGYNTDYIAIEQLLKMNTIYTSTPFAVRGNGGMAKAVLGALHDNGFNNGVVIARKEKEGQALASLYGYTYQSDNMPTNAKLIINATPIGMEGGAQSTSLSFTKEEISAAEVVFDVVALPVETPLIKEATRQEKQIISGADVAVIQSLEQFVLYTGVRPSIDLIKEASDYAREYIAEHP